jgi:hypothetical protein
MSAQIINRVIEWSPNGVIGFDAATRQVVQAEDLARLTSTFGTGPVVVAVSRRATFVKAVRVPNASAGEIDLILATQMASMFPVPLSELAYAVKLTDEVNEEGRLAVIAAMRESDLQALHAEAKAAGLKVERVVPAAYGSVLVANELGLRDVAIVQDSVEGLAIDLLANGELRYSRVAPMPANDELTGSEISRSFQAVGIAETPTLAAGSFAYAGAQHKHQRSTLESFAGVPLDRLGMHLETREARSKRETSKQANRARLAVLMCAAAGLLALLVYMDWMDAAEEVRVSRAKWDRDLKSLKNDAARLETEVSKLNATADTLSRAFSPAQTAGDLLSAASFHTPRGLWLTGATFERGKIAYIRGTSSTSENVASYLQSLTAEPRLRDVKLVFANNGEIDKTPVVQFSIQAFPVGNLPLVDPKKKGAKK